MPLSLASRRRQVLSPRIAWGLSRTAVDRNAVCAYHGQRESA
ncbi:hypothetical protein EV666_1143 [Camelimonas lactis]|uniref:Uncharacterized protein n=1 Tax=Camelimonas lactis TaxID=659006 RepID=A0A4R2GMN8_9HYPH|nr:hypothetical protein EV666_1143 [Camelimonas lactis]